MSQLVKGLFLMSGGLENCENNLTTVKDAFNACDKIFRGFRLAGGFSLYIIFASFNDHCLGTLTLASKGFERQP